MTENTITNKTTETTTVPTANTSGKAFKNVVLFPFRVVKFLLKWGFRTMLALLIILTLFYAVNAATPMDVPEAHGMTTYQLLGDRFKVMVMDNKDGQPLYLLPMVLLSPLGYFSGPFVVLLCELFPESKFDKWVKTSHIITGNNYNHFKPKVEARWSNFPKMLAESLDLYTWQVWVLNAQTFPYPQLPTNK